MDPKDRSADTPNEAQSRIRTRPSRCLWVKNVDGGSDFWTGGDDLSVRTVINSVPTQWWREASHGLNFGNVVKVTTRGDFDEHVDAQYSQSLELRAMDLSRQLDVYKVLGPLDRPKAEGFWKPKGADIVAIRPRARDISTHTQWPYWDRTLLPKAQKTREATPVDQEMINSCLRAHGEKKYRSTSTTHLLTLYYQSAITAPPDQIKNGPQGKCAVVKHLITNRGDKTRRFMSVAPPPCDYQPRLKQSRTKGRVAASKDPPPQDDKRDLESCTFFHRQYSFH
ncbi:hypothetical protein E4T43_04543 [Aureobasidium subglaciale]|nr:hypothetical protein E4T43_04543 [Aureobasidium subglaciale]